MLHNHLICSMYDLKHVEEWEQKIRELHESKVSLSDRLTQQKRHLIELCGTNCNLGPDIENLQDTKHAVRSKYYTVYCLTTY